MTIIAVGGVRATSDSINYYTTRAYNTSGNLLWSDDLGSQVNAVCVTPTDDVIAVGGNKVRKYNSSGSILWTVDASHSTLYAVAIDSDGNIYIGGNAYNIDDNYYNLTKYDSSGNFVSRGLNGDGNAVRCIAIGADGIYVVKTVASNNAIKYDTGLSAVWTRSYNNGNLYGVIVDSNENVTVCGYRTSGGNIRSYDSSGTLRWSYQHGTANVYGVTGDSSGNVYFAGDYSSSTLSRAGKLSAIDGALLSSSNGHGTILRCIDLSADESTIVIGGNRSGIKTHGLYSSSFVEQWTGDHYGIVYGIAITKSFTIDVTYLTPNGASIIRFSSNASFGFIEQSLSFNVVTHLLTRTNWPKPTTIYVALFSSMDPLTEITASGYQRVLYGPSDSAWGYSNNQFSNNLAIQFRPFSETIVGYGLYAKSSGGLPIFTKTLTTPIVVTISQPGCYFAKQQLIITLD